MNTVSYSSILNLVKDHSNRLRTLSRLLNEIEILERIIELKKGDEIFCLINSHKYDDAIILCQSLTEDFHDIKRTRLIKIARQHNIKYYGKLTKLELIRELLQRGVKLSS